MLLTTGLDQRLTRLIIRRLRREWPLLRFVPAVAIAPVVAPAAIRIRRSLLKAGAATTAVAIAAALAALAIL